MTVQILAAGDLDAAAIAAIAAGATVELGPSLLAAIGARRILVEKALQSGRTVYGVNTGLGALSDQRLTNQQLSDPETTAHQGNLLLGRAVGSAPWLSRGQARAVLATRLASLLTGDAGVRPELCVGLAQLLNHDVTPLIPAAGAGSAGEIVPLAHAFLPLIGIGQVLGADDVAGGQTAAQALAAAGLVPMALAAKDGIALLEGVAGSAGVAILASARAASLIDFAIGVSAGAVAAARATRDPYSAATARGDADLAFVLSLFRIAAGDEASPRGLQAPVSFRVVGPVLAHVRRSAAQLDEAIGRSLTGVTDSPAFLDTPDGVFIGTAGFHGIDLAAACDALTIATVHAAEMATAQLHRLLDAAVTGLPAQLTPRPGPECGLVAVHKRAVGVTHSMRALAMPACVGSIETSAGQEDLQSCSWQAARELDLALDSWREVLACQLLAVWRACQFTDRQPSPRLGALLAEVDAVVPVITGDRPFGADIDAITALLSR